MSLRVATLAAPAAIIVAGMTALPQNASAEMAFSVYGGYQSAPHSEIDINNQDAFTAGWEGKPFTAPPHWGVRGTWWLDQFDMPNLGISLDYSHDKVYADSETLSKSGWSHFEFTDGINLLTLNALYRFPIKETKWTPYVGAGAGINVPHVEVTRASGETFDYQFGGATLQAQAGIAYSFLENWDAFLEYKATYSWVDVDIDSGDSLQTNIFTNAVNVGVSYRF
ncbi:outer membrane protein [Martelella mediterranea]|uniref:Lipid A oxidase n=1 Tax=Martelella mediterranea TaxID=293089 RepID=A0A4R3NRW1_9HYPH|nr:porin family protein [Martelella mediterranea]TCT38832.1 lipid A oxidase [Martelella mediterranea]